jgi:Zn-dependent M32 family carboxypeptidase
LPNDRGDQQQARHDEKKEGKARLGISKSEGAGGVLDDVHFCEASFWPGY